MSNFIHADPFAGIAWVMCGHVVHVANGSIHTGNGCPHNLPPGYLTVPGRVGLKVGDPAMYTEDEQWFDLWGAPQTERATEDVAYGVASYLATGGSMHNYYMWHGGNHYGNWSTAAQHGRSAADVDTAPAAAGPSLAVHASGAAAGTGTGTGTGTFGPSTIPPLGGGSAFTNTVRYANSAPLHSDGSRNEPRFSHLAALHALFRAHAGELLTSSPNVSSWGGPRGLQVVAYRAITFAMNNNPLRNQSLEVEGLLGPGTRSFLPGQSLVAFATLGGGRSSAAVLYNTSAPVAVAEPPYEPLAAALSWSVWPDAAAAGQWHRASVTLGAACAGASTGALLLDLHGMGAGMAFVNGKHVANYNLALGNCSAPRPSRCGASPIRPPGSDGDGGCGQASQRYYHIPPEVLAAACAAGARAEEAAAVVAEVLLLETGEPKCCGLHTPCKPCGNAKAGTAVIIDPSQVRVVSKRTGGAHVRAGRHS
jgi:hypothetical protein